MTDALQKILLNIENINQEIQLIKKFIDKKEACICKNLRSINSLSFYNKLNEILDNQNLCCENASKNTELLQLIVSPLAGQKGKANNIHKYLTTETNPVDYFKNWIKDTDHLIICDQYFFSMQNSNETTIQKAINNFKSILGSNLNLSVEIFHNDTEANPELLKKFKEEFKKVKTYSSEYIHDRVWIKNNNEAKLCGASINGFFKKESKNQPMKNAVFFIVDFPLDDLKKFSNEILNKIRGNQT